MSATDYTKVFAADSAANEVGAFTANQPSGASMSLWNGNNLHYAPVIVFCTRGGLYIGAAGYKSRLLARFNFRECKRTRYTTLRTSIGRPVDSRCAPKAKLFTPPNQKK